MSTITLDKTISAVPITPELFSQYGGVISSSHQLANVQSASANQGTATKLFKVSPVVNNYSHATAPATCNWNMFRCTPPQHLIQDGVYSSKVLERHPYSTQTFVPMGRSKRETAYMVIVAPTGPDGGPDINGVEAFLCRGDQAVTYGVATWHAPMIALGDVTDFAVLIHENGVANDDCQEVFLDTLKVEFGQLGLNLTNMDLGPRAAKRKGQSEEAWQKELEQFHSNGPVTQDANYFKDVNTDDNASKMDLNRVKYAAEHEYYLGNYRTAEQIIQANINNFKGRLAEELHVILRAVRAKF